MNYQINRYKVNIYIGLYNGFHGFKTAFMTLKHNLKNKNKKIIKKKHKNTKRKKKKKDHRAPLVRWSLYKYKYLWGVGG